MLPNIRSLVRDLAGDLLYATNITRPSKRKKQHPLSIVTFHRVLPAKLLNAYPIKGIAVTPDELSWFINHFRKHFICGTLSENFERWQSGEHTERPLLSITFDDGQLDNFLYARPILKSTGTPATFFVVVDATEHNQLLWYDRLAYAIVRLLEQRPAELKHKLDRLGLEINSTVQDIVTIVLEKAKTIDADDRMNWVKEFELESGELACPSWDGIMTWKQLAHLIQEGHEIGCHSMSHPILPLCNESELHTEIISSRKILREKLNIAVSSFCFPNGNIDERTIQLTREAGYRQAVTTRWGQNTKDTHSLMLKRFDIQSQTSRSRNGDLSVARLSWRMSQYFPGRM